MSKDKNPRRVAENEAMAVSRMLRTSPQKLNLVAGLIRNQPASQAVATLTFSKRRIAQQVRKARKACQQITGGRGVPRPAAVARGNDRGAVETDRRQPVLGREARDPAALAMHQHDRLIAAAVQPRGQAQRRLVAAADQISPGKGEQHARRCRHLAARPGSAAATCPRGAGWGAAATGWGDAAVALGRVISSTSPGSRAMSGAASIRSGVPSVARVTTKPGCSAASGSCASSPASMAWVSSRSCCRLSTAT